MNIMANKEETDENPHILIHAPCEILTCKICGKEYPSRGKYDPGYCRECEDKVIK